MRLLLNINQSLEAIRANGFRAGVTIFIIALGITALVVVMTSIAGISKGMGETFSSLGANTFRIQNQASQVTFGGRGRTRQKRNPDITYREAVEFQTAFDTLSAGVVSITGSGPFNSRVKYRSTETNPNIQLVGTDQHIGETARYIIEEGRSLTSEDVALARAVVVLGYDVKEKLFPYETAVGKYVNVNSQIYLCIGSYAKMGTSGLSGADRTAVIPISTLRNHYPSTGSLTLNVYVPDAAEMEYVMAEAQGLMRLVRKLRLNDEDDFAVSKSDAFVEQFLQQIGVITMAATVIALITLLGASVALLNVMLVSVTERTMEIGLRKALGATKSHIRGQFLIEAIVICQIGGLLGILMGVIGGNIVSNLAFQGGFVVPWNWIIIGLIACFMVGIGAGYYPAWKASNVDPIESLRAA
ncbi:MAG: ABC transporter permease [Bacteroidia bacterium]|nr:ABC transporter permease [Bacteroidia bacterium]